MRTITIKEFVALLHQIGRVYITDTKAASYHGSFLYLLKDPSELMEYGVESGWLMPQDELYQNKKIENREAARIIHRYLKKEWSEEDIFWHPSTYQIADLFDCKTCADSIAQVYSKGIMNVMRDQGHINFASNETISEQKAREVIDRVYWKELRFSVENNSEMRDYDGPYLINQEEALRTLCKTGGYLLAVGNVNNLDEISVNNVINIGFTQVLEHADCLKLDVMERIIVCAENAHIARVVSECLVERGYRNITYFEKR